MDVNNFGIFHADVWGTVADCIVAVGTIITIVYLIITFEKQRSLYKIEKKKYRSSKMPVFNVLIDQAPYKTNSEFFIKLVNTNNIARQVTFESKEYYQLYSYRDSYFTHDSVPEIKEGSSIGYGKLIGDLIPNETFIIKVNLYKEPTMEFYILFSLNFYDEDSENKYIQYFGVNFTKGKTAKKIPKIFKEGMKSVEEIGNL